MPRQKASRTRCSICLYRTKKKVYFNCDNCGKHIKVCNKCMGQSGWKYKLTGIFGYSRNLREYDFCTVNCILTSRKFYWHGARCNFLMKYEAEIIADMLATFHNDINEFLIISDLTKIVTKYVYKKT